MFNVSIQIIFYEKYDWSSNSMMKCKFKKVNNWTKTTHAQMGAFDYTTNGVTMPVHSCMTPWSGQWSWYKLTHNTPKHFQTCHKINNSVVSYKTVEDQQNSYYNLLPSIVIQYMGLKVFNWPISTKVIERINYSSCYHHQIGSINLSHYHIFPWLCAWDVCYIIFCHLLHIHSGKTGILFTLLLCRLWWVRIFGYVLVCRSYSFVCTLHHLIIIIMQTYLQILNL